MLTIDHHPTQQHLRSFGKLLAMFVPIAGALFWWRASLNAAMAVWMVGGVLTAFYWLLPFVRRHVYVGWMYAAFPIGWTVSHALMAVIYFGVMMPIGVMLRIRGYDPLARRFDRAATTYWRAHTAPRGVEHYFRQY